MYPNISLIQLLYFW